MSDFRQYRASNQSWPEFQDFINHKIVKMTNNEAITKKSFRRKWLKNFLNTMDLTIWDF